MKYEEEGKLAFCFPLEKEVGEFGKGMARDGKQICKKKKGRDTESGTPHLKDFSDVRDSQRAILYTQYRGTQTFL